MEHSENHRKSLMIPLELLLISRQIGRPCFPSLFPWTGSTYITRKRYCWCTEKQSWVLRVLSFVAMNWITNPLKYEEILTGSCQESKLEKEHPWLHKKNWLYLYLSRLSFSLKYKMIWTFNILFFFTWTLHMRGGNNEKIILSYINFRGVCEYREHFWSDKIFSWHKKNWVYNICSGNTWRNEEHERPEQAFKHLMYFFFLGKRSFWKATSEIYRCKVFLESD